MKVLLSCLLNGMLALLCTVNAQQNGQLVIFIQDGRSISQDFKRNALPEIKNIAQKNGLQIKIVDASKGAPREVTYTPAIFFAKDGEKVLYDGRYNEFEDLAAFVKSQGKQQPVVNVKDKDSSIAWEIGRATIKTTMQINPLTGKPPRSKKFNADEFEKEAGKAIVEGMEYFRLDAATSQLLESKSFHVEFYPEVDAREGVLLIQMELYSEFDSQTPIFKTNIPTGNDWKEWQIAFQKAGNRIEKAVIAQISNWDHGDGFDTLKTNIPTRSWSEALSFESGSAPFINDDKGSGDLVSERE